MLDDLFFLVGNMTEHNLGNFSMNIPTNATFNESVEANGCDAIRAMAIKYFDGAVNITFSDLNGKSIICRVFTPCMGILSLFISCLICDCNEDNMTFDNVAEKLYLSGKQVIKLKFKNIMFIVISTKSL